jgi:hypothetical protein
MLFFLIRPLFKGLWPLDGIAWFPVLALGTALIIFPAYGFRPECVPLALNHLVLTLMNLKPLLMGHIGRHAGFHERGGLFIVPALGFLVLVGAAALYFAPVPRVTPSPRTLTLQAPGRAGSPRYTLHIFEGGASEAAGSPDRPDSPGTRPLIFLVPPDFGRLDAVDSLCAALGERGFTVISYTRANSASPGRLFRLWRAFRDGTRLKKANDAGRALEAERRAEVEFLLPYVKQNLASLAPAANGEALFLAGWGAGGSALASAGLPGSYGALGLIVVEGRFWSSWAPPPAPSGSPSGFPARFLAWLGRLKPGRVELGEAPPRPPIPTLYLVSDRSSGGGGDEGAYAAVFAALRNAESPAVLARLEGAGPLDYSDLPAEYPLYNALLSGRPGGYAGEGAALIARFCALVAAGPLQSSSAFTGRLRLPGGLSLETRYWNFEELRLH